MAWNVFKFCTALRALGSIMIVLVLAIVGVTYYAIVIGNYGPALLHGGADTLTSLAVLLLFHFLLVMLFWCYTCVVVSDPGGVPSNWMAVRDEETADTDPLMDTRNKIVQLASLQSSMMGKSANQDIRFCRKCKHLKPPRAHHCSTCKRCILKMDHHCVWVVNCVGALNYKHFLLFLFYTFLETSLVTVSLFPVFLSIFRDGEISQTPESLAATFITFVLNIAFALSIMGFLIMHISLVAANTTTIEAFEKKTIPNWHYDLGWKKNFEQVFGAQKKLWLIPAYSEDDLKRIPALRGLEFPTRNDMEPLQQF